MMTATTSMKPAPRAETTRMFESDFIERFSRIHPSTPFVFWIPVIVAMLYRSVQRGLALGSLALLFAAGVLLWTLTEYVLHRYVFHWVNDTAWGKRIHFVLHGVHHDYPNDKDRLVMPLGASIPLGVVIYAAFYFLVGPLHGEAVYAGMALGYLGYDGTHYAVHHFKQGSRVGKFLRRHHMLHHHADHDGGFGVSSPLWDLVFGTMPHAKKRSPSRDAAA
jgi:sterol desaturase/sphingolipid hydroxylase (fatty acid hydroxylase superfamily)